MIKIINEETQFNHLFKVGQKVKVKIKDDVLSKPKLYDGIVKEMFDDHMIVDVDDMNWYVDEDNIGDIYPEYNF